MTMQAQGRVNGQTELTQSNSEDGVRVGILSAGGEGTLLGEAGVHPVRGVSAGLRADLEDIYRAPEAGSIELRSAMRLLPEAVSWAESAIEALDAGEPFQADDAMLHVHSLIPELFCCRGLGDGFGAVINAILSSFEKRQGLPMEIGHLEAIRRALSAIRSEPRMSFDRALDLISVMEEAGLSVDPAGADELAEWLSE